MSQNYAIFPRNILSIPCKICVTSQSVNVSSMTNINPLIKKILWKLK